MSFSTANSTVIDMSNLPDTFSDYQTEFSALLKSCETAIDAAKSTQVLDQADRNLQEATDLLKSMELEAQSHEAPIRDKLRNNISISRNDLARVRKELRTARISHAQQREDSNRASLFASAHATDSSLDQRGRLLDSTQKLERGSEMILDSRRNIAETEMIGASILEDLQSQRNTITRARQNLGNVDSGLDQSNSILATMRRRAVVNKIIVYIVLAVIGMACLGIIYTRLFHGGK